MKALPAPRHPKTKRELVGGFNPVAIVRSVIGLKAKETTL